MRRRRALPVRLALSGCALTAGLLILCLVAGGVFVAFLSHGPIVIEGLGGRIAAALEARVGHGFAFTVGDTAIAKRGYGPTLSIDGLTLKSAVGETLLSAPRAEVSIDPFALLAGNVTPKRLELIGVELRLALQADGSLAISSGPGTAGAATSAPGIAAAPIPLLPPGALQADPALPPAKLPRSVLIKQAAGAVRVLIDNLTSPNSPIAAIDRVGITGGRLVIEDQATDQTTVFDGLELAFDKTVAGTSFGLAVDGPNGRLSAAATARGAPGTERHLDVALRGISADELALAAGQRNLGVDFDMPLAADFSLTQTPQGTMADASGHFELGAGYLRFDDPDFEPMLVQSIKGGFHWDGGTRQIIVDKSVLDASGSHFAMSGTILPPVNEGDTWKIALANAEPGLFAAERPGERPINIAHMELAARLDLAAKHFFVDRFAVSGPDTGFALSADMDWQSGPHLRLGASLDPMPVRTVVRLWPSFIASSVRAWFLSHALDGIVRNGKIQIDFDPAAIKAMREDRPPPDGATSIDFTIANGRVAFLPGVPPLGNIEGVGHVTGRTSAFNVTGGTIEASLGRKVMLAEASFVVPNAALKPTPATLSAHLIGSVEAVSDIISRDALKAYATLPLDAATVKGQADGRLGIEMTLGPGSSADDTALRINATVTNFVAEKLIGKEKLDAATLAIVVDPSGLKASGQGRMFGGPAVLELTKPANKPGEASVNVVIDDAARARLGLNALPGLSGPIGAHIVAPIGGSDKVKAQVELDLTRVAIEAPLPGVSKPAGRPGKVTFTASSGDDTTLLDQIVLDMGAVQARGSIELGADQSLVAAKFAQVKLSPGDDMKLDVTKVGETTKVVVRGTTIDARPFMKPLAIASGDSAAANAATSAATKDVIGPKDVDIDVKAGLLTGYNKQVVTGIDLRLVKHGEQVRQFALGGRFGRETLVGSISGSGQIDLTSGDAGSLLAFIDLYKHMEGGRLAAAIRVGDGTLAGRLDIKDFVLRDEPALRRMVAEGVPPPSAGEERASAPRQIDANAVAFNKLQVRYERAGSTLELHDGTMYGANIGLTVDGSLDFAHDRVNMRGTFVPAYAVNNLFSQIPLVGPLLGGGSHEGLFAVNYRITGQASSPTLNINPLSAIAPGFLRKIFGAGDLSDPNAPSLTGTGARR